MQEPKTSLGRPPKPEGKRAKKIDVRFTEEEYQKIVEMEKEFGISKADLVRRRLLDGNEGLVINARLLITEIDEIGTELGRAGNNINQLAHHANSMRLRGWLEPSVIASFNTQLEQYLVLQSRLEVSLRKIIRAMSNH